MRTELWMSGDIAGVLKSIAFATMANADAIPAERLRGIQDTLLAVGLALHALSPDVESQIRLIYNRRGAHITTGGSHD